MTERSRRRASRARARRPNRGAGPNPTDVHVGLRLRAARLAKGLSQQELGAGIGVSFQAVQKYERGENRVSASRLFRAAQFLGRPAAFFFEEIAGAKRLGDQAPLTREEVELVGFFHRIEDSAVREKLMVLAKRVALLAPKASRRRPRR